MRQGPEEVPASPTSQGGGNFDFVVEGEPARILTMIRGYFESDEWPYREKSKVWGPDLATRTKLTCVVEPPLSKIGLLSTLLVGDDFWPRVEVTAYPESPGVCKVTLTSEKKPEYVEPVAAWIQRELVEKKRAVEAPQQTAPTPSQEGLATQQPTSSSSSGDIPDQIRKLAELRDAGVISVEEFETKKRDLLDRM